ncbi:MAG: efflux RND transporter periplasmic adaptor subunit [Muribaculaceae bacterium]|jgi:membrane fusion protein (multidrug efflux system)|nr:efflux RND transporter periplasmic adaptor subunit [Muribaculaceae bacterium]
MKNRKVHSLAAVVAATATVFTFTSCGDKSGQQMPADMTPEIGILTVQEGSSDLNSSYAATIKGKTDVDVRPFVSGFITKVNVDEGQYVKKGQPLFTLDQVQYQAAVDQAAASVNSARTALESAKLTAANKQHLFDKNIISEYENQLAKNSLAQAEAQLAQAEAALTTARKNLSYTVVTAPSNGFVGSIINREGSLASPSMVTPLTTLSDNSDIYAYFSLNEKDILEMTKGGKSLNEAIAQLPPVMLRLSDGTIYPEPGKVATVSGVIDNSTGSANVRARFKNDNGMLRSGSTGQILIPNHKENVILIPQKATFEIQNRRFVYVVNDSNKTVSTAITVAPENDGQQFIVTNGLKPGERVVVEGVGTKVRDNMPIKPFDAAARAAAMAAQQQQAAPQQ